MRAPLCLLGLLLPTVACSDDAATPLDGPPPVDARPPDAAPDAPAGPDLSCLGDAPPTTAPAMITVRSTLTDLATGQPVADVGYELRRRIDDTIAGAATSAADGRVAVTVATGGAPLDVYVRYGKAGYATFYDYFADPLIADLTLVDGVTTPAGYAGYYPVDLPADPAAGTLALVVRDCAGAPLPGVAIALTPPAARMIGLTAGVTGPTGEVYGLNVPAGAVTIAMTLDGTALQSQAVTAFASGVTYLEVHP